MPKVSKYEQGFAKYFHTYFISGLAIFPYGFCLLALGPLFKDPLTFFRLWTDLMGYFGVPISIGVIIYLISKGKKGGLPNDSFRNFISKYSTKVFLSGIVLFYVIEVGIIFLKPAYIGLAVMNLIGSFFILPGAVVIFFVALYQIRKTEKNLLLNNPGDSKPAQYEQVQDL